MGMRVLCTSKNVIQIGDVLARFMSTGGSSNIGFIGLGNMGGHMANNLMKQVRISWVFFLNRIRPYQTYLSQRHTPKSRVMLHNLIA